MRKLIFKIVFVFLLVTQVPVANSQTNKQKPYQDVAEKIYDLSLSEGQAYEMLRELCLNIGPRLSGSTQAAAAVDWGRQKMLSYNLDNVHLQPITVEHWVRGEVERAKVVNSKKVGSVELTVCALGRSIGTPELGITGPVIEVQNFEKVQALGKKAKGAIIFYNRSFDRKQRQMFAAYSGAVNQRGLGAIEAAKVGASAVLVRSMTSRIDDAPHTGAMRYDEKVEKIPAAAISTLDADFLSKLLKEEKDLQINLQLNCKTLPDAHSANVIGEITGSEKPEEVILLGGHLDSWDKGHGAHDDGSGCVQSIEALRLIKTLDLKPKRTIRAVLFMNEENGVGGGRAYGKLVGESGPKHIAAIESDRGGFTPRGISVQLKANDSRFQKIQSWSYLFSSIRADQIEVGYGGVDISPLMEHGAVAMGLVVDSNRYFDYHHSDNDTFDKVNERELEMGASTMAIMAYVIANEGL